MDNEVKEKTTNKKLVTLIIILVFVILGLSSYIVYDQFFTKNNTNEKETLSKIDASKDWVYDAAYESEVTETSYKTSSGRKYYLKDIKVPYVNIDNSAAKTANNGLKVIFNNAISNYKLGLQDKQTYVDSCNYSSTIIGNMLSFVVKYGIGATAVVRPEYYAYNFDLSTGNVLTYQEVYEKLKFNSSTIQDRTKTAITSFMQEELKNMKADNYLPGTNFDTVNNKTYQNYLDAVNNNTIKYFVDSNNKLNIVIKVATQGETNNSNIIVTIN